MFKILAVIERQKFYRCTKWKPIPKIYFWFLLSWSLLGFKFPPLAREVLKVPCIELAETDPCHCSLSDLWKHEPPPLHSFRRGKLKAQSSLKSRKRVPDLKLGVSLLASYSNFALEVSEGKKTGRTRKPNIKKKLLKFRTHRSGSWLEISWWSTSFLEVLCPDYLGCISFPWVLDCGLRLLCMGNTTWESWSPHSILCSAKQGCPGLLMNSCLKTFNS